MLLWTMQNNTQNSMRDECARLHAKLDTLEQRQGAAAQQASDAAHAHSLHAKQLERSCEEHQHRLSASLKKAESRGQEAAEQIAQRAVADSQTSMQVSSLSDCVYVSSDSVSSICQQHAPQA